MVRPDLLDDWIPELNDVDAQTISCTDNVEQVWWRCPRCSTRYQSTVRSRVARGRTACPACSNSVGGGGGGGDATAVEAPAATAMAARPPATHPLSLTHPALAARWDTERNGGLTPLHVGADSTRQVWWRSAVSTDPQRSFRRPVFAFVRNSASPWEQSAATASLEWRLLQQIREAARVEEAEKLGSIPVTLIAAGASSLQNPPVWREGAAEAEVTTDTQRKSGGDDEDGAANTYHAATLPTREDAAAVALLWKAYAKPQLAQKQKRRDDGKTAEEEEETTVPNSADLPKARELFSLTHTAGRNSLLGELAAVAPLHSGSGGTAAVVREALLNQYVDFVQQQRRQQREHQRTDAAAPSLPPPVLHLDGAARPAESAASPSSGQWVDFFRLSREEVLPKGYVDPSAALYFSTDGATAAAAQANAGVTATIVSRALSSIAKEAIPPAPASAITPADEAELVFAYYPRRPDNPPAWEDDVMESLPPAVDGAVATLWREKEQHPTRASQTGAARKRFPTYNPLFRIETPFGKTVGDDGGMDGAADAAAAAHLRQEYDNDDEDDGLQRSAAHDPGAVLAAELRSGAGSSTTTGGSTSLVNSAIAALGSAFASTGGDGAFAGGDRGDRERRYRRGVQAPSALNFGDTTSTTANASGAVRHFKLSMPQEGLGGSLKWRRNVPELAKATGTSAQSEASAAPPSSTPSVQFDAPRTPRKVARPRKLRKDTAEVQGTE